MGIRASPRPSPSPRQPGHQGQRRKEFQTSGHKKDPQEKAGDLQEALWNGSRTNRPGNYTGTHARPFEKGEEAGQNQQRQKDRKHAKGTKGGRRKEMEKEKSQGRDSERTQRGGSGNGNRKEEKGKKESHS